jgi:hypothetical protein
MEKYRYPPGVGCWQPCFTSTLRTLLQGHPLDRADRNHAATKAIATTLESLPSLIIFESNDPNALKPEDLLCHSSNCYHFSKTPPPWIPRLPTHQLIPLLTLSTALCVICSQPQQHEMWALSLGAKPLIFARVQL